MTQVGQFVEICRAADNVVIHTAGHVLAVERMSGWGRSWEIVSIRVSLGRFGTRDVVTFGDHIRPVYTLAQEERDKAQGKNPADARKDPERTTTDKVLGLSRTDPPPPEPLVDVSALKKLETRLGWTRHEPEEEDAETT